MTGAIVKKEAEELEKDGWMVENNAAWPLIFIHQSSTSGNCLPVSECTDGRLGVCVCVKETIRCLSSFRYLPFSRFHLAWHRLS